MTRDGFTLLVMGYTGELAMKFKEAYIRQFNAMERLVSGLVDCGWDHGRIKDFVERYNTKQMAA